MVINTHIHNDAHTHQSMAAHHQKYDDFAEQTPATQMNGVYGAYTTHFNRERESASCIYTQTSLVKNACPIHTLNKI